MKHDPVRAQRVIDGSLWRTFRLFQAITGTSMDAAYYTPLAKRKMSFKEFMLEWVVDQHELDVTRLRTGKALVLEPVPELSQSWTPCPAPGNMVLASHSLLEAERRRL